MHYNLNPPAAQCLSTVLLPLHEASLLPSSGPTSGAPAFSVSTVAANNHKRKRRPAGTPDPDAEVVALSPKTLMESDRYVCEICNQGFQREQNLQMHRRRHKVPWKLLKRPSADQVRKRVYVCPEPACLHHDPCHALGDLVGIKKHYRRKHSCVKKWECEKCYKAYAVQSDYKAHVKGCGTRGHCCDCGRVFSRVESFIEHQDTCGAARNKTAVDASSGHAAALLPSLGDNQKATSPAPSADTVNDYHHHMIMNASSLNADRDRTAPSPLSTAAGAAVRFIHESAPSLPNSATLALPAAPPRPPPAAAPASSWAAVQQLMPTSEKQQRGAELQLLPTKHLHVEYSQSSVTWGKDVPSAISSAACSPSKTGEKTAKSWQKNSAPPKLQLSMSLYQESCCDTSTPLMSRPSEEKDSCLMPNSDTMAWLAWRPMDSLLPVPARLNDDASVPMAMATAKRCSTSSNKQLAASGGCATDTGHTTNLELVTSTWVNPAPQPNGTELVSQTKSCNGRRSSSELKDTFTSSSCGMLQEYQGASMEVSTSAQDLAVQQQRRLCRESAAVEAPCHDSEQKIPGHKLLQGRCNSAAELLMQEAEEQLKRASAEKLQAERAWQEAKRERELAEAELASAHRIREHAHSQLLLLKAAAFHHTSSSSSCSSNSHSSYFQLHRFNRLITCPTCHQTQIVYPAANKAAPLVPDTLAGAYPEFPPIIANKLTSANRSSNEQRRNPLDMP